MIEPSIRNKARGLVLFLSTLSAHDMTNFNTMVKMTPLTKLRSIQHKAPNHAKMMAYYMVVAKAIQILTEDRNASDS